MSEKVDSLEELEEKIDKLIWFLAEKMGKNFCEGKTFPLADMKVPELCDGGSKVLSKCEEKPRKLVTILNHVEIRLNKEIVDRYKKMKQKKENDDRWEKTQAANRKSLETAIQSRNIAIIGILLSIIAILVAILVAIWSANKQIPTNGIT